MHHTKQMVSGLLMVCLACGLAISDEPAKKQAKAPEAGDPPPRKAGAGEVDAFFEAVEQVGFAEALALRVDPQVAKLENQILPQIAPLLTAELSFINRACDLNLEQRKKIKAASAACLRGAARGYALAQNAGQRRQRQVGGSQATVPDPTELLHQALAETLQETLQPQQKAAYDDEMAKRRTYRKRVAVEAVVALIDERLVLTVDQRQKLVESLDKNWQSAWVQSIEMALNNNQYFIPPIPDQFVAPTLNEAQREVWRTIPKRSYATWGGFDGGNQGRAVDDFPLDEAAADVETTAAN